MTRLFILFAFLFHSLQAGEETYPFFGITGSLQTIDLQATVNSANEVNAITSVDSTAFGIQYGVQTKDYRTTFSYETTSDFQTFDVGVDYIFMDEMFGTAKVRPYIGATIGYMLYDEALMVTYNAENISANQANNTDTTVSTSDGYYGLDLGFIFYITDNIDFDIGYHYYLVDRLTPLDRMTGFSFSLHYFY